MKKKELEIISLTHSTAQNHSYAIILGEQKGNRRLPIIIGGFEAQAIAVALERMTPNRPLTHDLLKNVLDSFEVDLQEVLINDFQEGVFFARLICTKNGERVEIDSRTSDAIALAVRCACPIYTYEFILEAAGIVIDQEELDSETKPPKTKTTLADFSLEKLNEMLEEELEQENYEKAAAIRDEIKRRQA